MRKGITDVIINSILTMVMIIVAFSIGFFIYSTYASNAITSSVLQSFDSFVDPIRKTCETGEYNEAYDISMPLDPNYVYGIMQTIISSYDTGMPVQMKKCLGSYCLCLFRVRNPGNWDMWNKDIGAPLWHWNPPGLDIFPKFILKVAAQWAITMAIQLLIQQFTKYIVSYVTGKISCNVNPVYAGACNLAVDVASNAIAYAITGFCTEFAKTLILELWESLVFFGYPNNVMSTASAGNLEYKDSSSSFNCQLALAAPGADWSILFDALKAGAVGALEGAINGAISGFFKGLNIEDIGHFKIGKLLGNKLVKGIVKGLLKLGTFTLKMKLRTWLAKERVESTGEPLELKPECHVADLITGRLYVDPDEFVWSGRFAAPNSIRNQDAYDFAAGELDVIECVKISELGSHCDEDTKILLDSGHDVFLNYRLTDPFTDPWKSLFCVYSQLEQDVNMDFLEEIFRQILFDTICPIEGLCPFIKDFLKFTIGEIMLAGQYAIKGLFTECVATRIIPVEESEYFQYWVPYPDYYEVASGGSGQISLLTTELMTGDQGTCQSEVLPKWKDCMANAVTSLASLVSGVNIVDLIAVQTLSRDGLLEYYKYLKEKLDALESFLTFFGSDYDASKDQLYVNMLECKDVWNLEYERCKPGIHINPIGVIR